MDVCSLRKEIHDIQARALPLADAHDDHLEKLFDVFLQIDAAIADCPADDSAEADAKSAGLIEAQTVVMRTAAAMPARCMRDLLYKLAMWRWDCAELDRPMEQINRGEAIAYSAFLDLSKMLGEHSVLKDFDKTNWR